MLSDKLVTFIIKESNEYLNNKKGTVSVKEIYFKQPKAGILAKVFLTVK